MRIKSAYLTLLWILSLVLTGCASTDQGSATSGPYPKDYKQIVTSYIQQKAPVVTFPIVQGGSLPFTLKSVDVSSPVASPEQNGWIVRATRRYRSAHGGSIDSPATVIIKDNRVVSASMEI